ncbi:hypothetical protein AK88_04054 [Plasmodium fragile]|uniref:Merozoite surface protein C-terminal domain-containing protein n=1 Tax=Plasmodium fragile TaxID=5857 RepID=A0A0D9QGZ4_PLAFR|nr:uncharacterized protein AK88_04054 [Plasmodium fragile]KJP86335.1 hypothetical protein AK88_04054 [Plasmodium fragile]
MKSSIVLVSCLLLLCAGPTLGKDNKKEKKKTHKGDADNNYNDELKALKEKLENLKFQMKDDNLSKKITEDQILTLKKKLEEFKNLKSDKEAKGRSPTGHTSPGHKGQLGLSDKKFAGQSVKANEEQALESTGVVSGGGPSKGDQGVTEPAVTAGATDKVNESPPQKPTNDVVVTEVTSGANAQGQTTGGGSSNPTVVQGKGASSPKSELAVEEASGGLKNSAQPTKAAGPAGPVVSTASTVAAAPNQKVNSAGKVHHLDILYDELLAGDNKKNMMDQGTHHSAYNNFRKQYDNIVLNQTEYDISLKLLDTMLSSGKLGAEKTNALKETFEKAMYDKKYSEKFNNLISGVYGFAKRNNFLDGNKVKGGHYNKLFDYTGNLMNTLLL